MDFTSRILLILLALLYGYSINTGVELIGENEWLGAGITILVGAFLGNLLVKYVEKLIKDGNG